MTMSRFCRKERVRCFGTSWAGPLANGNGGDGDGSGCMLGSPIT